jgi:FMN phosphatase YigB (HAD superfamily)
MVPWGDINTVFLDMDGTLLDLNFDNHFWLEHVPLRYAEARGLAPAAAKAELLERYRSREGTLEWYCVDHWSRELGLDIAGHVIGPRQDLEDYAGAWANAREVRDSGIVLVRPDQHVAWRRETIAADPAGELRRVLKTILDR